MPSLATVLAQPTPALALAQSALCLHVIRGEVNIAGALIPACGGAGSHFYLLKIGSEEQSHPVLTVLTYFFSAHKVKSLA